MITVDFKELAGLAGQDLGASDWLLVDQNRVNRFADATGDHQWIHVDVERATQMLGGTVVHGYLILSLLPMMRDGLLDLSGVAYAINYGLDRVRFVTMLKVGKRIRLRLKMLDAHPHGPGLLVKIECTVEIEGETKPACVAETLALVVGG